MTLSETMRLTTYQFLKILNGCEDIDSEDIEKRCEDIEKIARDDDETTLPSTQPVAYLGSCVGGGGREPCLVLYPRMFFNASINQSINPLFQHTITIQ